MTLKKHKLYNELAGYYDVLYAGKDYRGEVAKLIPLIRKYTRSGGSKLLEVACGTGRHAQHLKKSFSVLATDSSASMLGIARRNVKGVAFQQADMMTLDLGKRFDAIVCLFSSIAYVRTYANLGKTLRNISRHLKQGGVVLIEPWFAGATYKAGIPHLTTSKSGNLTVTRLSAGKLRRDVSILDISLMIAEKGKPPRYLVDRHELALFEPDRFLELMRRSGLRAGFQKHGLTKNKGLYIGVKT